MVLMLEEKFMSTDRLRKLTDREKQSDFLLTLLAQGLQNGLACNQVVNKMSLEQVYIINMGFHFLYISF
jgi:hypothetical protein